MQKLIPKWSGKKSWRSILATPKSIPLNVIFCAFFSTFFQTAQADFIDELPQLSKTPMTKENASNKNPNEPSDVRGQNLDKKIEPVTIEQHTDSNTTDKEQTIKSNKTEKSKKTKTSAESSLPNKETNTSKNTSSNNDGGLFSSQIIQHNREAPISTQGDFLEGSLAKGKLTLTGKVEILQDDTLMKSDTADIFAKSGTTTPERALARGNVSLLKRPAPKVPEIRAIASELEYFIAQRRVILRGKPKIWRGIELIQGEVIELFLDTGDIRIQSARSILDPNKVNNSDKKNDSKKRHSKTEANPPKQKGEEQ